MHGLVTPARALRFRGRGGRCWYRGSVTRGRHVGGRGRLVILALASCGVVLVSGAPAMAASAAPTRSQLVGQRLIVAFGGTHAGTGLLARVRAGQVGGVILFSRNIASASQVAALTSSLQAAAHAGGQPRLIIATDQEGGLVKRIPWAPPNMSAQMLGTLPDGRSARSGAGTGRALRALGINVDLAPVADVPAGPSDFIERQHRAFSTSRFTVASHAAAFASGLESGHVWPTLKHFPGLGLAAVSTDDALVRITATKRKLTRALLPYQVALRRSLHPVVMLSTAVYPALDWRAAAWSPPVIHGLLRSTLGFAGVTATDSLDAAARVRHRPTTAVALRSADAGADLLLVTGPAATSRRVFERLMRAARSGGLRGSQLTASYDRIRALKRRLPG
jgi:beta-N-acetylhexosaminidase